MGAEALSLFGENIPKQHSAPGQQACLEVRQKVDVQIFTMKVTVLVILLSACVLCNAAGDENSLKSLENTNDGQIRNAREAFASSLKDEDMKKGKKNKRKIKKRNKKAKQRKEGKNVKTKESRKNQMERVDKLRRGLKKERKERKNKGKSQKSNGKSGQTKKGAKKRTRYKRKKE